MQSNMNRRAVLAGAATIPCVTLPALPALGSEPDPVYLAIAKHREAFRLWTEALDISGELSVADTMADELTAERCHAETDAACDLAGIVPTTMAGVIALLTYIDDCNSGRVRAGKNNSPYTNDLWPDSEREIEANDDSRSPVPFAFWIMRNVEQALRNITAAA